MSDKLRPEDLTSEERAIVDNAALFYRRVTGAVGETAEWAYVEALKEAEPIILARRALFAPAPEKVAKVETMADRIAADLKAGTFRGEQPAPPAPEKAEKVCGNCGEKVSSLSDHVTCAETGDYYCQPAPPEPAAPEMPEAVKWAIDFLRELGNEGNPNKQCTENICRQRADALESWWRNLAQADPEYLVAVGKAIAAVRQKAAQPRRMELGKVRAYFNTPFALRTVGDEREALAELDAAEGKGEGRG